MFSKVCGWISVEHPRVDADIGDADPAAMIRPGSSRCAGLRRKKVTVSVARTASP